DEVATAVRLCHAHRLPMVPQGGLTGLAGGATPRAGAVAISLTRLAAIEAVDATAGTLTVQAGATLQQVQEAIAPHGLVFGVDLAPRGTCQIGGMLSANAGGLGVIQYGTMRAQVLGLEVVLADGTVLPMLRPLYKNNTGYDLAQLFVGAEGTLGIITRAVLRLHPAPRARATAWVALPDYAAAGRLLARLKAAFPAALAAFELMWDDFVQAARIATGQTPPLASGSLAAVIDVSGADASELEDALGRTLADAIEAGDVHDAVLAQSGRQAQALWRLRESVAEIFSRRRPLNFDIGLPIARIGAFVDDTRAALAARWPGVDALFFGHIGDGNVHIIIDLDTLPAGTPAEAADALVYARVADCGGSVSAEHGIGTLKRPWLAASRTAEELAAMRAIKAALDPLGLMNPGKIFG
ncbi:MAG: FAD-binding oxidoreductase, partial [Rhodocyclaceae bacterium]